MGQLFNLYERDLDSMEADLGGRHGAHGQGIPAWAESPEGCADKDGGKGYAEQGFKGLSKASSCYLLRTGLKLHEVLVGSMLRTILKYVVFWVFGCSINASTGKWLTFGTRYIFNIFQIEFHSHSTRPHL